MENKEKVKELVRKLLRMDTEHGCTEPEAAMAIDRANALLEKYNLTLGDIGPEDHEIAAAMGQEFFKSSGYNWHRYLICYIAKHCMCYGVMKTSPGYSDKFGGVTGYGVYVFGRQANIQATRLMFDWIEPQVTRLCLEYIRTLPARERGRQRNSFLMGIIERLNARLKEMRNERLQNEANTKALVITLTDQAITFGKKELGGTRNYRGGSYNMGPGYQAGQNAASKVSFSSSYHVGGPGTLRLGAG